ncbi:DEAD/DEAH box helicase [marine sediment metagenome]|uniref:DEAD/DEAH box helicase n=1 Tax=marine sediment metagenome TaxID=412755 RepID=A0A1B6NR14_9ZZZZ
MLVPANRFEALECQAAITAIEKGELDGESPQPGALDIVPQFILNCLCSRADSPDTLYQEILTATPYQGLDRDDFASCGNLPKTAAVRLMRMKDISADKKRRWHLLASESAGYSTAQTKHRHNR